MKEESKHHETVPMVDQQSSGDTTESPRTPVDDDTTETSRTHSDDDTTETSRMHSDDDATDTSRIHSDDETIASGKGRPKHKTASEADTAASQRKLCLIHTCVFYFGFILFGWVMGQRGTVFLDLLLVTKTDLTLGSILFNLFGLAAITGALAGGFLLDATRRPVLMMTTMMAANAVINSTLALCEVLPLMATEYFVSHFAFSVYDVVVNSELANLWPGKSGDSYMLGLHLFYAVGAIVSPLVTQPFLAPRAKDVHLIPIKEVEEAFAAEDHPKDASYDTVLSGLQASNSSNGTNTTTTTTTAVGLFISGVNGTNATTAAPGEELHVITAEDSNVFYALLLSGILCLLAAIVHGAMFKFPAKDRRKRSSKKKKKKGKEVEEEEDSNSNKDDDEEDRVPDRLRKVYYLALVMTGLFNFFGSAVEDMFPNYLLTFVVRELDWSKSNGAHITSVYWVGLSVGRLSGVWLVKVMTATKLMVLCLAAMIASLLALLLASVLRADWAVWLSCAAVGLSTSVQFPTGLIYAHERVARLSGRLAALIFTAPMMSAMMNPTLLAWLMTRYDDLWFVHVFLIHTLLSVAAFAVLHVLTIKLGVARRRRMSLTVTVEGKEEEGEEEAEEMLVEEEGIGDKERGEGGGREEKGQCGGETCGGDGGVVSSCC